MSKRNGNGAKPVWENRIVGYGDEDADQLLANDKNWRIHPKNQQDALAGVLREVGIVQNILVNRQSGMVVDGHLRVALALRDGQKRIPVTYVDLTPAEEALILASLDPIGALAATDKEQLAALLNSVNTGEAAVQQMLEDLAIKVGVVPPDDADWDSALGDLPDGDRAPFQQMTFTLADAQAEMVKEALQKAKDSGDFGDTGNLNSNGNALARICEAYLVG